MCRAAAAIRRGVYCKACSHAALAIERDPHDAAGGRVIGVDDRERIGAGDRTAQGEGSREEDRSHTSSMVLAFIRITLRLALGTFRNTCYSTRSARSNSSGLLLA